jgi:hypothetical protein
MLAYEIGVSWPPTLNVEEDFLSYAQYEKESLPDFYWSFLHLKAQALKVSDDQVITQAIKALCTGQTHNHLTREHPITLKELYDSF